MQKVAIEDFGMIHLSMGGKAFGEITASYSIDVCENWVEWHGTKGSAMVSYWNEGRPDLAYRHDYTAWIPVDCTAHLKDRYTVAIQYFVECVRAKKQPSVGAEDGLKTSRIVKGVYEAARTGRRISLK
jgi:predicted dehydrogenase